MSHPGIQRSFIVLIAFIMLAGCKSAIKSSEPYISKQEAIAAALEIASISSPEISGAQVMPFNIGAEQMTLDEAVKKINKDNQPATRYDPNMTVWFVTMEGLWLDEFPRPEGFPTPVPYHHYAIIIDATTGSGIEVSASP